MTSRKERIEVRNFLVLFLFFCFVTYSFRRTASNDLFSFTIHVRNKATRKLSKSNLHSINASVLIGIFWWVAIFFPKEHATLPLNLTELDA